MARLLTEPGLVAQARDRVYGALVADLYRDLAGGKLQVGDRLPTENQLAGTYGIGINSVRSGIKLFVDRGLIRRRRGSGMYVSALPLPPAESVRCDTIAICFDTRLNHYHPYYSELRRGIREELDRSGWKSTWIGEEAFPPLPTGADIDVVELSSEAIGRELASRPGLAGALLPGGCAGEIAEACGGDLPLVVTSRCDHLPSVGYDWDEELCSAIRDVLRRGARSLLVIGSAAILPAATLVDRAAFLECGAAAAIDCLDFEPPLNQRLFTRVAHECYSRTRELLSAHEAIDGVVIGSDYPAQGALDAVAEVQRETSRTFAVAALINRESRIRSAVPFTAVIANGYEVGVAAVQLLHERITQPQSARYSFRLRGTIQEIE